MPWLLFVVFVYIVLTVCEIVCALGVVSCCFLAVAIGACWWRADVDDLEDIDGTSRFVRQLRLDDAKSKVPRAKGTADDDAVTGSTVVAGPAVPAATDEGTVVVPVAADKGADNGAEVPLPRTTVGDDAGGDDSEDAAPHFPTNEAWLISNLRADIYSLRIDTSPHIIASPLFEYADPSDIYEDADILLMELRAHTGEDESSPIQRIIDNAGAQYDNPSHICEGLARAFDRLANRFQACGIHSEQPAEPVSTEVATEQAKSVAHTNNVGTTVPSAGPASTTDTTEGRKAKRAGKTKNNSPTKGADGTKTTKSRAEKVGGNRATSSKVCANKADGGDKSTSKPPVRNDGSASRSKPRAHNSSDGSANAPHDSKTENIFTSGSNKGQPKARRNSVPAASSASTEPEVPNASSSSSDVTASTPTDQHEVPATSASAATQVPAIPEAIERVGGPTAVGATSLLAASHASGTRVLFASTPVLPVLPRASASEKGKAPDRSNADTVDTSSTEPANDYKITQVCVPEVSSSRWYMKLSKNTGSQFRGRFDTDVAKQEAEPLSSTGALHAVSPPVVDAEMEEVEPPVADTETDKESPTNDLDMEEPPVADADMNEEPPADDLNMKEPPVADAEMDEADAEMEDPPVADAEMVDGATTKMEEEVEVHVPVRDAATVEVEMLKLGRPHVQPRKQRPARAATSTLPLNTYGQGPGGALPNPTIPVAGGFNFGDNTAPAHTHEDSNLERLIRLYRNMSERERSKFFDEAIALGSVQDTESTTTPAANDTGAGSNTVSVINPGAGPFRFVFGNTGVDDTISLYRNLSVEKRLQFVEEA
ncbi:hypothetical protein FBU31_002336 [Coemansia sp. 'formosensis']|nr:hypothetical protein FBU31_002336 [Coemansia sp. 'formosensis']